MSVIVEIIIGMIGQEALEEIGIFIYDLIKNIKDWSETSAADDIQATMESVVGAVNQHLYNQQRTNDLLEMILLSLIVFITFYVLRMCLNKGAWS